MHVGARPRTGVISLAALVVSSLLAALCSSASAATTPPPPPSDVRQFAVLGGLGVTWTHPLSATASNLQRLDGGTWVDIATVPRPATLAQERGSVVDRDVAAGAGATYRVVAENDAGRGTPSDHVEGMRPGSDPQQGSIDAFAYDLVDTGGTVASRSTYDDVVRAQDDGTFWAESGVWIRLPDLRNGPGTYPFTSPGLVNGCYNDPGSGDLVVHEVAYDESAKGLALITASFTYRCDSYKGDYNLAGELRLGSTHGAPAVRVSAEPTDLGRVPVGTRSTPATVTVTNIGTAPVTVGAASFTGTAAADWQVEAHRCPGTLAVAAACQVDVTVTPTASGLRQVSTVIQDGTIRRSHATSVSATGTSLPVPGDLTAIRTLTSVALSWSYPDDGGTAVQGYVIHKYVGDEYTRRQVQGLRWTDTEAPVGARYAISVVNEIGESEPGPVTTPTVSGTGLIYSGTDILSGQPPTTTLRTYPLPGGSYGGVPLEESSERGVVEHLAVSPDGRDRVTVRADAGGRSLWRESMGGGTPVRILGPIDRLTSPQWSPDGTRVAFITQNSVGGDDTLRIVPAAGGVVTTVGPVPGSVVSWMPDNRSFVVSNGQGELEVIAAAPGGTRLRSIAGPRWASQPSVSPDGRWVSYASYNHDTGASSVQIVSVAGGTPTTLGGGGAHGRTSWSSDGSHLAWPGRYGAVVDLAVDGSGRPGEVAVHESLAADHVAALDWYGTGPVIAPTEVSVPQRSTVAFSTTAMAPGTSTTCQVDDAAPVACASPWRLPALSSGAHTVRVRATEPDGRAAVAARALTLRPTRFFDWNGDSKTDLVTRDGSGRMLLYPGTGSGGFAATRQIGTGWGGFSAITATDWDGDTKSDLVARDAPGRLHLYPGNGGGGFSKSRQIGTGWNAMTTIAAPGDLDGDRANDLLARNSEGRLILYPGTGDGGFKAPRAYGLGWNAMTAILTPGDFDGDGRADILTRDSSGRLYLYPGNGAGSFFARKQIGSGWNGMTVTSPGDFDGDGASDLLARNAEGRLLAYPGTGTGLIGAPVPYGLGWDTMTMLIG